jgi:hypothetical protein
MELATQSGFSPLESRQWYETLSALGVQGLQIRAMRSGDEPEVSETGVGGNKSYRVVGVLTADGVLVLPGNKRFRKTDRTGLRAWLDELRTWGPQGSPEGQAAFGLSAEAVKALMDDIRRPSGLASTDLALDDAATQLARQFRHPVDLTDDQKAALARNGKVGVSLDKIALGTSLAYVLRPAGLVWYPERTPTGEVRLRVVDSRQVQEFWPVGSEPDGRDVEALPILMEFIPVEIEPSPVLPVVETIRSRLDVPLVIDRNQLVKHGINLDAVQVSHPRKRSYYKKILETLLAPAGLQVQLRMDDNDKPFLWLTSLRP